IQQLPDKAPDRNESQADSPSITKSQFTDLTHVGIFNPRLNLTYRHAIEDVPDEVIATVRQGVIGYPS
ncbi:MAG: hypothetical protein ACTH7X_15620, partial [Brevibacterium aurantiacum]